MPSAPVRSCSPRASRPTSTWSWPGRSERPWVRAGCSAVPARAPRPDRSPEALLIELSKQLEREAMRLGETAVVAATFQEGRHFTPSTTQRYRDLVERTGFVCALGEGLPVEPLPGLRGADLRPDDVVRGEWDVVVLGPHFSAALLARDLGDDGPDLERTFEYALTYDRATVVRAAHALLSRVAPRVGAAPRAVEIRRAAPARV